MVKNMINPLSLTFTSTGFTVLPILTISTQMVQLGQGIFNNSKNELLRIEIIKPKYQNSYVKRLLIMRRLVYVYNAYTQSS